MTESSFGNFHVFSSEQSYEENKGSVKENDIAFVPSEPQTGPPGADGKSAYQAAVEGGFSGTESEFNTALAYLASNYKNFGTKKSTFETLVRGEF